MLPTTSLTGWYLSSWHSTVCFSHTGTAITTLAHIKRNAKRETTPTPPPSASQTQDVLPVLSLPLHQMLTPETQELADPSVLWFPACPKGLYHIIHDSGMTAIIPESGTFPNTNVQVNSAGYREYH